MGKHGPVVRVVLRMCQTRSCPQPFTLQLPFAVFFSRSRSLLAEPIVVPERQQAVVAEIQALVNHAASASREAIRQSAKVGGLRRKGCDAVRCCCMLLRATACGQWAESAPWCVCLRVWVRGWVCVWRRGLSTRRVS